MSCHFYTDDGSIFLNKAEARHYAHATGQGLYLYYYDHVYSKVNWQIEPPGTLDFYYKEQAQKIRDEYEYVILCYSGGEDSTNILETFYYNNIKLDKIVCVGALKQDEYSGVDTNHNAELYSNCFPYLEYLGLKNITQVCDYSEYFNDMGNFRIHKYGDQWTDKVSGWYSPHHWFWADIEKYVVPKHLDGKKVAIIFGIDKPYLQYHSTPYGRFPRFTFHDLPCTCYGVNLNSINSADRINFYWDPNNTSVLLKQLYFVRRNPTAPIYQLKRPLSFVSSKSPTQVFSTRDTFLLNHKNSDVYKFYLTGINKLRSKFGLNVTDKFTVFSKQYELL